MLGVRCSLISQFSVLSFQFSPFFVSFVSFVVKAVAVSDVSIKLDLDSAGGENIRRAFARLADPSEVLADFGEYKRRRIVLSMPRMPRLQRSSPGVPPATVTG